jgi:hypothetical protein
MRGLIRPAVTVIAAALAGGTVLAGCAGGGGPSFHPSGASLGRGAALAAPVATAPGGYQFPAAVSVQFTTPPSGSAVRRAIIPGYRDYVLSLWAAASSHGKDAAYQKLATGNAAAFARREISYLAHGRGLSGTIRYYDTTVPKIYYGRGADVTSCVDASRFTVVSTENGKTVGTVFPARYAHYLENTGLARRADGTWFVTQTGAFPASTSEGAMCR